MILLSLTMALSILILPGCKSGSSKTEVQDGVEFEIVDALKVINDQSNTLYYYFLASVTNNSDQVYHMSNLDYSMAARSGDENTAINAIDKMKTVITNSVQAGQSTFVYGYIGFANTKEKNVGLYFPKTDSYLPFSSVKVRELDDKNVLNTSDPAFTLYEDDFFVIEVNAEKLKYIYRKGSSAVTGLNITYRNKTDQRLVVPFLKPVCTIDGISIDKQKDPNKLKGMTLDELKKQDFKVDGKEPKTSSFKGETLGYQLYYLGEKQEVTCPISFQFKGIVPDFNSKVGSITVNISSPSLGYSQIMKVKV